MEFHPVNSDDLPPELLEDWLWIKGQLTRFGPIYDTNGEVRTGSVEHTLNRIQNVTGQKIAQRIYEPHEDLRSYIGESNGTQGN
jgi:hypothetical protein